MPTNDGLTMLVVGWPTAEAAAYKADVEANYLKTLELAPEFAERVRAATREERFAGGAVPNFFRKPYGPGWALVGDAGYNKDPITAQGISDAFHDAERVRDRARRDVRRRRARSTRPWPTTSATRDAARLPIYEFTTQLATLEAPPPEMQQLLAAAYGNQDAMDAFVSVIAGTMSPAEFFAPAPPPPDPVGQAKGSLETMPPRPTCSVQRRAVPVADVKATGRIRGTPASGSGCCGVDTAGSAAARSGPARPRGFAVARAGEVAVDVLAHLPRRVEAVAQHGEQLERLGHVGVVVDVELEQGERLDLCGHRQLPGVEVGEAVLVRLGHGRLRR